MNTGMYIVVIIILILFLIAIGISNKFTRLSIKINESLSGIDVALTKRHDVLTKMIDVVKGYTKHEKETLFEVVKLRNEMSINEKVKENEKMTNNLSKINILSESYPELKANENFITLQKAVFDVEEHLAASRRFYNSNVSKYNELLLTFPSSIVAKMKKLTKKDFFEATEIEKENVKID